MTQLFDMKARAIRRDRAARVGPALFLHERTFADCLDRIEDLRPAKGPALLIGCPDRQWPLRMRASADAVTVADPGPLFAAQAGGECVVEDDWTPPVAHFSLILAIGTLDTVNGLPLALRILRETLRPGGLLIGAMPGGETLPRLRAAMAAADRGTGAASPRIHPRIEAAALAPLLEQAGLERPVVDVDRIDIAYPSLDRLVGDLRAMGATNILQQRSGIPLIRAARDRARSEFTLGAQGGRVIETAEILHFAAWRGPA